MSVTIYHNPDCGTSRNVLALIRNSGDEPHIIEYLKTPPSRGELAGLIGRMGIPVRDINRPIVVTPQAVKLCRPSETVLDILPNPQRAAFAKEDGEVVVTAGGIQIMRPAP